MSFKIGDKVRLTDAAKKFFRGYEYFYDVDLTIIRFDVRYWVVTKDATNPTGLTLYVTDTEIKFAQQSVDLNNFKFKNPFVDLVRPMPIEKKQESEGDRMMAFFKASAHDSSYRKEYHNE